MKFTLIDKITDCNGTDSITAVKNLTLGEEYLADHFPGYPVMPGVLMLEAMTQAATWLIRIRTNFSASMIMLKETRNVKYGRFIVPGEQLTVTLSLMDISDGLARFKGTGTVEGQTAVTARLTLAYFNLADEDPSLADNDRALIETARKAFYDLGGSAYNSLIAQRS